MKGILFIVSTPIGNLEDITLRALRVLKEVEVIAAEDTRHTLKLLNYYQISKPLISYWSEKEKAKAEEVMERLSSGQSVALVSDAGTPGISDPGAVLIKRAVDEGIGVVAVPGPSAIIAALSVSGFATEEFCYAGFLPVKQSQRLRTLKELSLEKRTLVVYEAPHRIVQSLGDMAEVFGNRRAMLAREMTKLFEEIIRGSIADIRQRLETSKIAGEYVVVIEGRTEETAVSLDDAMDEVRLLMKKGLGRKDAVRKVADEYGLSKKELYDMSLKGE